MNCLVVISVGWICGITDEASEMIGEISSRKKNVLGWYPKLDYTLDIMCTIKNIYIYFNCIFILCFSFWKKIKLIVYELDIWLYFLTTQ